MILKKRIMANTFRQVIRRCSSHRPQSILLMGTLEPELPTDINRNNYKHFLDKDIMLIHKSFFPDFLRAASEPLGELQLLPVLRRFQKCYDYHGPNREVYSSFSIMQTYKSLEEPHKLTFDNLKLVSMLAWAAEGLITAALLYDSMIDNQETRWKKICWHKLNGIGTSTISDCNLLRATSYNVLKKYFGKHPLFSSMLNLMNGSISGITIGQIIDVGTKQVFQEQRDISVLTMKKYYQLVKHKAYITAIKNPILIALDLLNRKDYNDFIKADPIFAKLGPHFQINNDMWDCFGRFETYGRELGSDIEEGMLSWVVVKALEHANEEQKRLIQKNYGKPGANFRNVVLDVVKEINIIGKYYEYRDKLIDELNEDCQKLTNPGIQRLLQSFVKLVLDVNDDLYE